METIGQQKLWSFGSKTAGKAATVTTYTAIKGLGP